MKHLTTSTLALIVAASGAMAESHGDNGDSMNKDADMDMIDSAEMANMQGELIRSRDMTGGNVYTMDAAADEGWDSVRVHDQVAANWNTVGEIEDILLSRDGKVTGIVAEVGGFLDITDKHVMLSIDDVNLVAVDDTTYGYVTRKSEDELEELPGVDEAFWN